VSGLQLSTVNQSQSYGASPAIWNHSVTCHPTEVNIIPAKQTSTQFTYPGGKEG